MGVRGNCVVSFGLSSAPASLYILGESLAMGFLHVEHEGLIKRLGLQLDQNRKQKTEDGRQKFCPLPSVVCPLIYVVQAINTGRQAAAAIDRWGETRLTPGPVPGAKPCPQVAGLNITIDNKAYP